MSDEDARRAVHEALKGYLDEGEIPISWCLVIDIAGPDEVRYLAHRAGGGHDGNDLPMAWHALGMLQAGIDLARDQLRAMVADPDDPDDDDVE